MLSAIASAYLALAGSRPGVSQSIRLSQRIRAPKEIIWRACSEPQGLATWQADEVRGNSQLGGTLELSWGVLDARIELEVSEWIAGERITFEQENGRVRLEFGESRVTLTHEGFDPQQDVEGLTSAWRVALAQLGHAVERHPGRKRRVTWRARPLSTSPELVHLALTEPLFCQRWLATKGQITEVGQPYALELFGGYPCSGRVLANSPGRDVALSCKEAGDATLIARTFPLGAPTQRLVAFAWSEWGPPSERNAQYLAALERALERLEKLLTHVGVA